MRPLSRSTATRSPTEPSTRSRARSGETTAGRRTLWSGSCRWCCASGRQSSRGRGRWLGHARVPTYRNELLASYQSGREFDPELVEQLDLSPALVAATGIVCGKEAATRRRFPRSRRRFRARAGRNHARRDLGPRRLPARRPRCDDPAAGAGRQRAAADRPRGGARALRRRAGPGPTSSRCAATLRTDPGARGVGAKTVASCPAVPRWKRCSPQAGSRPRPSSSAFSSRSRRSTRPRRCPTFRIVEPDWAAGARQRRSSVSIASPRLREADALEPVSHPAMAISTRPVIITTPRPRSGSSRLLAALRPSSRAGGRREAIERAHYPDYVAWIAASRRSAGSTGTRSAADDVGGGQARRGVRDPCGRARRVRARPPTWPPRAPRSAMGFCIFGNAASPPAMRRRSSGIERVAIVDWDVHHGNGTEAIVRGDDSILFVSLHQWPFYPGRAGPGLERRAPSSTFRSPQVRATRATSSLQEDRRAGGRGVRARPPDRLGRIRRPRRRPPRRDAGHGGRIPELARAAPSSRRKSPPCSKAATTSRRCQASSRPRSTASRPSSIPHSETAGVRPGRLGAVQPASSCVEPAWSQYVAAGPFRGIAPALTIVIPPAEGSSGQLRRRISAARWRGARAPRGATRRRACGAGS